jgi:oligopeptidase B
MSEVKLRGSPQIVRNEFECKEMLVPSVDGEEVPMHLYFKKGSVDLNRRNRVLLEAYGAYGLNLSQSFNIVRTSAMERGWVIADAFVRGGGEKGISWHDKGKLLNKPNSIKDFIACAEFLIANRITHPNLLAAKGQSAGGSLVGHSVLNLRPDLFRACILNVPFLDMLSNLMDPTLPLS